MVTLSASGTRKKKICVELFFFHSLLSLFLDHRQRSKNEKKMQLVRQRQGSKSNLLDGGGGGGYRPPLYNRKPNAAPRTVDVPWRAIVR